MARIRAIDRFSAVKIDLDGLFERQHGLATRRQLIAAGVDDEAIRCALRSAKWQRVLPGMYASQSGQLTLEQRRVAAVLYTSPQAQLTGISGLLWHGFRQLPADPLIHVLVPHTTRRTSRGFVRVQRTLHLDLAPRQADGYAVCSVARAVADACRGLSDLRAVRTTVAEAVQRGLTTIDALQDELDRAGSNRTALFRRALREIESGARSAPEIDLQETLRPSTILPSICWNPQLKAHDGTPLPSPDGWLPDAGIALEVDSREYHLSPEDWQRTMRRHNVLTAHGALVLHFTPSEVRGRRRAVRGMVERAYQERSATGARTAIRLAAASPTTGAVPRAGGPRQT